MKYLKKNPTDGNIVQIIYIKKTLSRQWKRFAQFLSSDISGGNDQKFELLRLWLSFKVFRILFLQHRHKYIQQ